MKKLLYGLLIYLCLLANAFMGMASLFCVIFNAWRPANVTVNISLSESVLLTILFAVNTHASFLALKK